MMRNGQGLFLSIAVVALLVSGLAQQAHANQLDALLLPDKNKSVAEFAGVRFIELRYPQGSQVAALLNGKNERIEFNASGNLNASDSGMDKLLQAINKVLLTENKSPVAVENGTIKYVATVKGYSDRAQLSYRVEFKPTIARYVLQEPSGDDQPAIVDLDWRNVVIKEPLIINTEQFGTININQPIGALQELFPELAQNLLSSEAKEVMEDPILNFKQFDLPMKSWHFLFDVTGKQLERYNVFMEGEGGTVSIYSIGESSFREGTYLPAEKDVIANVGGTEVKVHASTPPPSGQITIAGYSSIGEQEGAEFAIVRSDAPGGLPAFGFQFQVLMVFGAIMAIVAVSVLLKARK